MTMSKMLSCDWHDVPRYCCHCHKPLDFVERMVVALFDETDDEAECRPCVEKVARIKSIAANN